MMQIPHIELTIIAINLQTIFDESLKDGHITKKIFFTNRSSCKRVQVKKNYKKVIYNRKTGLKLRSVNTFTILQERKKTDLRLEK